MKRAYRYTRPAMLAATCGLILLHSAAAADSPPSSSPSSAYARWELGPPRDPDFFPIAVWLQSPDKAKAYHDAGFNTYVGLWRGPTEAQLDTLGQNGMKLICHLNSVARQHLDDPTIIAWMHGDEPDNAQSLGQGRGYGPPILPARIVEDYSKLQATDSRRPVMLNLGQGVAWDGWHGRGVRTNHPEDYPEYLKGCDIVSFDIYPVAHTHPDVSGKLWYVARGVERLVQWSAGAKPVWNCIECTRIQTEDRKASPWQVRCEVWMSLIHGSQGLVYFVHEWKPKFNEAALLSDPEMLLAVSALNHQILDLAPVLNSPTRPGIATVVSSDPAAPVDLMLKQYQGDFYLFSVAMRSLATTATFTLKALPGSHSVQVLGEQRILTSEAGVFRDTFQPWAVHLYRISAQR